MMPWPLFNFRFSLRACAHGSALMLIAGCMNGYPSEDQPRDNAMSSRQHVRALNAYLEADDRDDPPHFKLLRPCLLKLSGLREAAGSRPRKIALDSMRIAERADKATGVFSVAISDISKGSRSVIHEFAVGGWIDAVAFRSHLQRLTMSCVESLGPDRKNAGATKPQPAGRLASPEAGMQAPGFD